MKYSWEKYRQLSDKLKLHKIFLSLTWNTLGQLGLAAGVAGSGSKDDDDADKDD